MYFYLYRDNYIIKIGAGGDQLKQKLQSQGYELFECALLTYEEAASAQQVWQEQINSRREQGLF